MLYYISGSVNEELLSRIEYGHFGPSPRKGGVWKIETQNTLYLLAFSHDQPEPDHFTQRQLDLLNFPDILLFLRSYSTLSGGWVKMTVFKAESISNPGGHCTSEELWGWAIP